MTQEKAPPSVGVTTPELWADFNSALTDGSIPTLAQYAREGYEPAVGDTVAVGDGDGLVVTCKVVSIAADGLVLVSPRTLPAGGGAQVQVFGKGGQ